jgi:hypothetical protein
LPEDFDVRRSPELRRALLRAVKTVAPGFAELPAVEKAKEVTP